MLVDLGYSKKGVPLLNTAYLWRSLPALFDVQIWLSLVSIFHRPPFYNKHTYTVSDVPSLFLYSGLKHLLFGWFP